MNGTKAPGPDGMPPIFFQQFWDIVGDDLTGMVGSFLSRGNLLRSLNKTNIVLMPKNDEANSFKDYRPISLCNTAYKVISKTMTNRLQPLMKDIILPYQNAFVKDRSIHDNLILAKEILHYINGCRKTKKSWAALKVDLHKAYDKISWQFLEDVLRHMKFPPLWCKLIVECVTTPSLRIKINGDYTDWFHPSSGLRQGDPLSPYLFVLCTNILSSYLIKAQNLKLIQGPKIHRQACPLNHLLYADDLLLFFNSTSLSCTRVDRLLHYFGEASGLFMNKHKSEIKVSPNTQDHLKNQIQSILHCPIVDILGKYLGGYIDGANPDRLNASLIISHLQQKLSGWKATFLSQAARYTLIQSVLATIPIYIVHFTTLTDKESKICDSLMNNFFWGSWGDRKVAHLISWKKICRMKDFGGLGLRKIKTLNQAILGKQAWRVISNQDCLMSQMMRKKYISSTKPWEIKKPYNASPLWRKIQKNTSILTNHIKWRVGNGHSIHLSDSKWFQPDHPAQGLEKVNQLLIAGRFWDHHKLRLLYDREKSNQILNINISHTNQPDKLIWDLTPHGQYEVKTAYNFLSSNSGSTIHRNVDWKEYWRLKLLYKILILWWKTLHNGLPLRLNLVKRGYQIDDICPFGCVTSESEQHLFKDCQFAKLVWFGSSLMLRTESITQPSIIDWIDDCFNQAIYSRDSNLINTVQDAILVCWSIYTHRNNFIFQNANKDPIAAIHQALTFKQKMYRSYNLDKEHHFFSIQDQSKNPRLHHLHTPPLRDFTHVFCCWKKDSRERVKKVFIFKKEHNSIFPLIMLVVNHRQNLFTTIAHCIRRWIQIQHSPLSNIVLQIPNCTLVSFPTNFAVPRNIGWHYLNPM
ncbi:ribonuclease H [Senna tora]|uniref:Ribonuclease H n=1 Tax=Senna tora TaxID=362788 RepID=A0A834X7B5_9FABA|nr:ribonuclease H [Senna tora]